MGHANRAGVSVGSVVGKLAEMAGKLSDTLPKLTDVGRPVNIAGKVPVRLRLSDSGGKVRDSVGELRDRVGKVSDGSCTVGIEIVDSVGKLTDKLGTLMDDKLLGRLASIRRRQGGSTDHCAGCWEAEV